MIFIFSERILVCFFYALFTFSFVRNFAVILQCFTQIKDFLLSLNRKSLFKCYSPSCWVYLKKNLPEVTDCVTRTLFFIMSRITKKHRPIVNSYFSIFEKKWEKEKVKFSIWRVSKKSRNPNQPYHYNYFSVNALGLQKLMSKWQSFTKNLY